MRIANNRGTPKFRKTRKPDFSRESAERYSIIAQLSHFFCKRLFSQKKFKNHEAREGLEEKYKDFA